MEWTLEQKKTLIIEWCRQLSMSQGFYGRLLRDLLEDEDYLNDVAEQFDGRTMFDFVMCVEC